MNFKSFLHSLLSYIQTHFPTYLALVYAAEHPPAEPPNPRDPTNYPPPAKYVHGYPDLERYTQEIVFYLLPADFEFQDLTNASEECLNEYKFYLTFRKYKSELLDEYQLKFPEAFYQMIKADPTLGGLIDYSLLTNLHFYSEIEGCDQGRAIEGTLHIVNEVR